MSEDLKRLTADVFDRAAPAYDAVGVPFFAPIARRLVELAAIGPGEHVLDVGTGRGAVLWEAAERVGPTGRVAATDLAPEMVRRTAADAAARGLAHVVVTVGDAEAPEFPDASFDAVLGGLVVFMLPDVPRALREYRRLLRPGGRLAFTTFPPNAAEFAAIGPVIGRFMPPGGPPGQAALADAAAIEAAVRAAGFADVEVVTESFDTAFRDAEQWWEWAWSQGQRVALERIPPAELDAVRAELDAALAAHARPDGSLPLRQRVTYTVATT
ncbi:MAG TPA: methyltransferase domain-containing protein [Mycobacteriales bacterium]|nr:methyltransferase domain-containing protein [Mycobacteriales bacterium]